MNSKEFHGNKRGSIAKRRKLRSKLLARDGDRCWYCSRPLQDNITFEHLTSHAEGGNWHLDNLVLVHEECNKELGERSRSEKEQMRQDVRSGKRMPPMHVSPISRSTFMNRNKMVDIVFDPIEDEKKIKQQMSRWGL